MRYLVKAVAVLFVVFTTLTSHADVQTKILLVLTSHDKLGDTGEKTGFWLSELTHPYYRFKKAGYSIDVASIQGGTAPIDHKIFELPEEHESNQRFLRDAELMSKVFRTMPVSTINPSEYAAIVFAGGSGTMWDFPDNEHVHRLTTGIYENGGIVSAICHGPAALVDIKLSNGAYLVSGKKVSAFTNEEEKDLKQTQVIPFLLQNKLIERGAKHVYGKPWKVNVVTDGRLITGQNPASAKKVAKTIIKHLNAR